MPQNKTETIPKISRNVYKISFIIYKMSICFNVAPVSSVTSAIRNVLYDIRTNKADSSSGKSRIRVNFVINAVAQPMTAPIISDNEKMRQKSPTE